MKKKIILIFSFLLIVGTSIVFIFKNNKKEVKELNINDILTINGTNTSVYEEFYITENNGLIINDLGNNLLYKYEDTYDSYVVFNNKYIFIYKDNITEIIDKYGKKIKEGKKIIFNDNLSFSNSCYVFIDNKLYDSNLEEIYVEDNDDILVYSVINNLLFITFENSNNKVIDLIENKVLYNDFNSYYVIENVDKDSRYVVLEKDDLYDLFDSKSKKIVINKAFVNKDMSMTKDKKTYYVYNNNIYQDGTKIDKYHMSSDGCGNGSKLVDDENNIIIDSCNLYYEKWFDNVYKGYSSDESTLLINNKIIKAKDINLEGDYIFSYDFDEDSSSSKIYNKKGEVIKEGLDLTHLTGDLYQGYDSTKIESYFLDKDLNIISEPFSYSNCEGYFCVVSDDKSYKYLYKNGVKISDVIYDDIVINSNFIVCKTLFYTYVYKLGYLEEVDINNEEILNVDVDKMIEKYNLNDIKTYIDKNKSFFEKYVYIVENNNNLSNYKKHVMDMFRVVVDNKKYLDEFNFLKKLQLLNIVYDDKLRSGVAAQYYDPDVKISYEYKDDNTMYHELMHFIDFSINKKSYNLYKCDNRYIVKDKYSDNCEFVNIDSNFIVEAGAELFSGKYFTNELDAYSPAPSILEAFEYILGTDVVNKWYFESDSYFKQVWFDIGYSYDLTEKVISSLNGKTSIPYVEGNNAVIVDALIDLYKYKNGNEYMNDNKFKYMIAYFTNGLDMKKSKYYNDIKIIEKEYKKVINMFNNKFNDYYLSKPLAEFLIKDGKIYLSLRCYKGSKYGVLYIDYDFDNNTINNYEYIEVN